MSNDADGKAGTQAQTMTLILTPEKADSVRLRVINPTVGFSQGSLVIALPADQLVGMMGAQSKMQLASNPVQTLFTALREAQCSFEIHAVLQRSALSNDARAHVDKQDMPIILGSRPAQGLAALLRATKPSDA